MDITPVFGTGIGGSNPPGGTKESSKLKSYDKTKEIQNSFLPTDRQKSKVNDRQYGINISKVLKIIIVMVSGGWRKFSKKIFANLSS